MQAGSDLSERLGASTEGFDHLGNMALSDIFEAVLKLKGWIPPNVVWEFRVLVWIARPQVKTAGLGNSSDAWRVRTKQALGGCFLGNRDCQIYRTTRSSPLTLHRRFQLRCLYILELRVHLIRSEWSPKFQKPRHNPSLQIFEAG